jgi:hypothetical protein
MNRGFVIAEYQSEYGGVGDLPGKAVLARRAVELGQANHGLDPKQYFSQVSYYLIEYHFAN